jgi:short-subunit dehydrogenase
LNAKQTYLITGASSGIGYAYALQRASKNTHFILLARRQARLENLQQQLLEQGSSADIFTIDMSNLESVEALAKKLAQQYTNINELFLNAGMSLGHGKMETSTQDFNYLFRVNFLSNHTLLTPLLKSIPEHGSVVFISSLASLITMPSSIAYSSSKRAINAYAEGLRYSLLDKKIDVVNILPGFITTELTDKNDFSMPFLLPIDKAIKRIIKAVDTKAENYLFPKRFALLIILLNWLPRSIRNWYIKRVYQKRVTQT